MLSLYCNLFFKYINSFPRVGGATPVQRPESKMSGVDSGHQAFGQALLVTEPQGSLGDGGVHGCLLENTECLHRVGLTCE